MQKKKIEYAGRAPLAFVSAVNGSIRCHLRTTDFNIKSEVAACMSELPPFVRM